jgi:hypothetical protein
MNEQIIPLNYKNFNNYMRKCATYLAVKTMQIRTTIRMANINITNNNKCWK